VPSMAPLLAAKEQVAARLEAVDEQARETTRRLRALTPHLDTSSSFGGVVNDLEARLATLNDERRAIVAEVDVANARIDDARERLRQDLTPALAALALPSIVERIAVLDVLITVQRLLVPKSTAHVAARQSIAAERAYLGALQDLLEGREA